MEDAMSKIVLIAIDKLKCHEEVIEEHVGKIRRQLMDDGKLKRPIVVDRDSMVILDGHHRYTALKRMEIKKIPCQMVDYRNGEVRVYLRRKELMEQFIKEAVVRMANSNELFPPKTTRHIIKKRIGLINYPLKIC